MYYLADTMALVWQVQRDRKLGKQAQRIFAEAEQGLHRLAISGVTLMEVMYLSERGRISVNLATLQNLFAQSSNYVVIPVSFDVVAASALIDDIPELHDRVIAGTAAWLNIPILTNDPDMTASRHVRTIWR
jgi:PIN domain nuclease of toxin-antitoxin system